MDSKENKLQQVFANEAIPDVPKANNPNNRRVSNRRVSFAATMKVHEFASAMRANQPSQQQQFASSSPTVSPSGANPFEAVHAPALTQSANMIVTKEVPVRDDSSFSSFLSDDDERERRESLMMEFTECVGGLIATLTDNNHDTGTVDLTMCVGELIKPDITDVSKSSPAFDVNNDMELTECVGGLIKDASVQPVIEEEDTEIVFQKTSIKYNQNNESLTMDITACVGAEELVGVRRGVDESPSPFLVAPSQTTSGRKGLGSNVHALKLIDEISGVDDLVAGSPMRVDEVTMDLTQVINEAIAANNAAPTDPSPLSQKAFLNEFLAESGIRFLDNVSSLTRRETMVMRIRESERMRPSSTGASVYVIEAVAPELAIYDKVSRSFMQFYF